jgi:hypothetical protein
MVGTIFTEKILTGHRMISNYNNVVFLAEPDRYGRFGHQTFSMMAAWALAHRLNAFFLPLPYSYFAVHHNTHASFSRSKRAIRLDINPIEDFVILSGLEPDDNGNTKYDLLDIENLCRFEGDMRVLHKPKVMQLVRLPFDQAPGALVWRLSSDMKRDLGLIFKAQGNSRCRNNDEILISIHIRRGDVSPERFPDWYISDHYFENLVIALFELNIGCLKIVVLTQGSSSFLADKRFEQLIADKRLCVRTTAQQWVNENEVSDFREMLNSDIIISGQSSFSQLACLVKDGVVNVCLLKNENSRLPHVIETKNVFYAESDLNTYECARIVANRIFHEYISTH